MILRDLVMTVSNTSASLDEPLQIYQYDRGITLRIKVMRYKFVFNKMTEQDIIVDSSIISARALILKPDGKTIFECPRTLVEDDYVIIPITLDWTDEDLEVGKYQLQLQLYGSDHVNERVTLPPVGFTVEKPLGHLPEEGVVPPPMDEFTNGNFFNLRTIYGTNLQYLFSYYPGTALDASLVDTSRATTMYCMFYYCDQLEKLTGISKWDTSNVTNMNGTFSSCVKLESLDLSGWNTSNVTSMIGMFANCTNLIELNISNFDMSNVSDTQDMFYECPNLQILRLDNCDPDTINKITGSESFPTNAIDGVTKTIYCREEYIDALRKPDNWEFSYVD